MALKIRYKKLFFLSLRIGIKPLQKLQCGGDLILSKKYTKDEMEEKRNITWNSNVENFRLVAALHLMDRHKIDLIHTCLMGCIIHCAIRIRSLLTFFLYFPLFSHSQSILKSSEWVGRILFFKHAARLNCFLIVDWLNVCTPKHIIHHLTNYMHLVVFFFFLFFS